MLNVGVVGVTGYTGEELIKVLLSHPFIRVSCIFSRSAASAPLSEIYPKFKGVSDLVCLKPDVKEMAEKCDLVFLALPHTVSMEFVPKLLKAGKRIVDLSADYRLKNTATYEKFYNIQHKDKENLVLGVYGLPEIYRNKIKGAKLVANPGCYPTAAILGLAPLLACDLIEYDSIIIDAKSGVTGAGRKIAQDFLFSEVNENFKAYKINTHQHMPEIEQVLSKLSVKRVKITFVAHLLPLNRGILETIYVKKIKKTKQSGQAGKSKNQNLVSLYKRFYSKEPFVRVRDEGSFPEIKDVVNTNFCDIGIKEGQDSVIIVAAIDNLLKGAAGQAVQNMNIMYRFPEYTALI